LNFVEPWLRAMFGYLGLENMQFILVDGTAKVKTGECDREASLSPHIEAIRALFFRDPLFATNTVVGQGDPQAGWAACGVILH